MGALKALGRRISDQLEVRGINLYRNRFTTGLTPQHQVINLLNRIRPNENGHKLIRIGGPGDGGYLVPDDLMGITECFSPGSNKLSNFEGDLADRWKIKSFICDSVEEKPSELSNHQDFTAAWVGPASDNDKFISLEDWVKMKSQSSGDLILQMDIEGAEFLTLLAVSTELLAKFRIVVVELHFLEALKNRWAFSQIYLPFFERLLKIFDVVHLHPNNCCGTWNYGDFEFPRIIELTLHRKDRSKYLLPKIISRNVLDQPCVESNQDFSLDFSELHDRIILKWDQGKNG